MGCFKLSPKARVMLSACIRIGYEGAEVDDLTPDEWKAIELFMDALDESPDSPIEIAVRAET